MNFIEGYVSAISVSPGEVVDFHVRTEPPHSSFQIQIFRKLKVESLVHSGFGIADSFDTPTNAYEIGCGWPSAYTFTVPSDWSSGVYLARLKSNLDTGVATDILFVVRAVTPGETSKILFQLAVNTYQAYNSWGGKSFYPFNSTDGVKSNRVSFERPVGYDDFYLWEYPFIIWLENKGIVVEYCTNIDLHANEDLLSNYQLLLSVGHDEYWSWEMRDNVEAFIATSGNVAFFGGNLCWWQVRFEDNNRTMVCYKSVSEEPMNQVNPERVTINWKDAPVNRPENQMTGVSFAHGAGWYNPDAGPRPMVGYQVRLSQHWAFEQTGLRKGDEFGAEASIIGYETDAARFGEQNETLQATGEQGTPLNFVILATADLSGWEPGGQAGMATMGIYRNPGFVFTAATTDWAKGLLDANTVVAQITDNVLRNLSSKRPLFPEIQNTAFSEWLDDSHPQDWVLEGSGSVSRDSQPRTSGASGLLMNALAGQTWLIQGPFQCTSQRLYRIAGWVRSSRPGATLRLQSINTWKDFVVARHSGSGQWEYISAISKPLNEVDGFPARVKVEVTSGVIAQVEQVMVEIL